MVATSEPGSADQQVVCIGLPQILVDRIAGILGNDVLLIDVADMGRAVATLTATARLTTKAPKAVLSPGPTAGPNVQLDRPGRRALHGGRDLRLSAREFDLLTLFLDNPGRAWSYEELSNLVWRQPYLGDPDTIATAVRRLRKRLGLEASVEITALRGFGYRLDISDNSDDIAS